MVNTSILLWVRCSVVVIMTMLGGMLFGGAQATTLGQTVTNVAALSYDGPDGERTRVLTNPASFVIEAERTQSIVEFYRFSPNAPDARSVQIYGSDYSPSGAVNGPFIGIGPARRIGSASEIDLSAPISLIPASTYQTGELMFVCVEDAGQNGDPNVVETVVLTITTNTGDLITLRLYESGPDTGEFWAYVPSNRDTTPQNDPTLTTEAGTMLTATYIDSFDETEVSVDTALVDPYGRVFNGFTGELINDVRVTLINASTGQPADVFGIDGFSSYPNTMLTGHDVTDESGLIYEMRPGEFRFPLIALGDYYVTVEPTEGLSFPSRLVEADFAGLENGPFVIESDASYGDQFTLAGTAPLNFDIPLDAQTDFVLGKTAEPNVGDVGDFITYSVSVENQGQAGAPIVLTDTMPTGFTFVEGSARLGGQSFADPMRSGSDLSFDLGALGPGASRNLSYVLQIGAGVRPGLAVNQIVARDIDGADTSNIARAGVTIREDLLRSTSTIVGRISENSCDGDEDWSREITRGDGVKGVRLYMETGAYAITDEDGLYHFTGVTEGIHVVQLDEETLPDGYVPMTCEESSRYAGSETSKFVEVQGGGLWRSNFYLKQTGVAAIETEVKIFSDLTEYKDYDSSWLGKQNAEPSWVYPNPDRTPSTPSTNIGIKHGPNEKITLHINGKPVASTNFASRDSNAARSVMISRWRGVDLQDGRNSFVAYVTDLDENPVRTITNDIYFARNIARAKALPDQSILVADGRTNPELAIRLEDEAGRPIHKGRIAKIAVLPPYRLENKSRLDGTEELIAPNSAYVDVSVGIDGIARAVLEPSLRTGKITIIVTLDDGREIEMFMYMEPEKRDWIIVGLAEGSAAYKSLKNEAVALLSGETDGLVRDGRVAFFAKGLIKGDWLLTLAVDTDKRRGIRDGDFNTHIDPNAYYTLYGDRSYNEFEAASRYPVYVKLEKKSFYAMFGDYNTNITEGKLTRYSRNLSGLKSEYLGQSFQATVFGAETNQGFAKDEIAANGTSGAYQLSRFPVLANSETILVETRDRVRPDRILATRRLVRHLDYTLNTHTGALIFRLPVDVSDSGFNPNVIIVNYETAEDAERNLTYGGRVQKQLIDGNVQIGSTFVHEGGNNNSAGGLADMIGAEIIAQIAPGTEMRAEYAYTSAKDASDRRQNASAYLAEIVHTSEKFTADAYLRQEDAGYGLRQTSSASAATRRYGANLAYQIREFSNDDNGRRGTNNISASAYREDNLGTGASRTASEINIDHKSETINASTGLRNVSDDLAGGGKRKSLLALAKVSYALPKHGLTVQVAREQPIGGKDGVDQHPARTRIALDKTITQKASVRISHDILDGENTGGQNTAIGVTYAPWSGTAITLGSDIIATDSGRRIGGTAALDQQFQINEKWSTSFGVSNRRVLGESGIIAQVAPDAALSSLETNQSSTSVYLGLGYRADKISVSGRMEVRETGPNNDYIASFAAARELSETLSYAGAVRANWSDIKSSSAGDTPFASTNIDGRFGTAWRPRDEDLIVLNRFDIKYENGKSGTRTLKLVNNLTANAQVNDRWQLAAHYGVKYVDTQIGDGTSAVHYDGFSHLLGAETRFDITQRLDLGLSGSVMTSGGTTSYAYGPSIGISPVDNVWLSLGYNVAGYTEDDFSAAEYSRSGVYVKFRFKFDQNTARGLLDMISPDGK